MKLIVGLGNPGEKYQQTRHNVGFLVVDALKNIPKHPDMLLIKPQTFMNNSGQEVARLAKKYRIKTDDLIVIHDDLDIPLGEYKIQMAKGPKVHNGVNSVEDHLKTDQFIRVRVGIENRDPEHRVPGETYVLQRFSDDEIHILEEVIEKIVIELMHDH